MRLRLFGLLGGIYLFLSVILRIVLWISFGESAKVTLFDLPSILLIGLVNDSLQLIYLLAPLTLLSLLIPPRWFQKKTFEKVTATLVFALLFGLFYLQPVEYFFFDEFDSRFNLVAVDYLMYPHEVFVNLWESFPIMWFLAGNTILTLLAYKYVWPRIKTSFITDRMDARPWSFAIKHFALVVLMAFTFSTNSLHFSSNRVINEISSNGISSLFNALWSSELDYNLYYSTLSNDKAYSIMRQHLSKLGGELTFDTGNSISRSFKGSTNGYGKKNIIILSEESLGAGFVGAYGDTRGLTPNFDRLSKTGLLFENAYATGTRTVRGLEAMMTSFPPIPSESILKRPNNEDIANWGEVLKKHDYRVSFLYGGFGMFDNMNHFFGSNGFELSDRTDVKEQTFANIWGVCDQDLFKHAMSYYDDVSKNGQPFFSLIMTTSNHKPYTFPKGIPGVPESGGGRDAGVRYADYAIGEFFKEAPKHDWFKNSIIVVIADHDARVYGRALVPVERYRIPLLIIADGVITPGTIDTRISQIDLMPTVIGMLGLPYEGPFYGNNVLVKDFPTKQPVLISHNHNVAMLDKNSLSVLGLQKTESTYSYNPVTNIQKQIKPKRKALKLATSYFQTAFELFQNHKYVLQ